MRILITNDDGVLAPGVKALHGALSDYADCVVVAPHEDPSGASRLSRTSYRPLRPFTLENGFVGLNGTPTDCVHLGLNAFYEDSIDMVVAGINHGANLGDDVLYSGTVAAALEGRFLSRTAMAFSLVGRQTDNLASAADIARRMVEMHDQLDLPPRTILNVNIPNLPREQIKGIRQAGSLGGSAGQGGLLDFRGRGCRGRWRRYRLPCSDAGLRFGYATAGRQDALRGVRPSRPVAAGTRVNAGA